MDVQAIDPATGRVLASWSRTEPSSVDRAIESARVAQRAWAERDPEARVAPLARAAEVLRARAPALAMLLADEMGRPVREGRAEIGRAVEMLDHLARHGVRHLATERVSPSAPRTFVRIDPLGVVLATLDGVNVPEDVVQAFAAALVAGNAVVARPDPRAPATALALMQVFDAAGLPGGLVHVVRIPQDEAQAWAADPRVDGVQARGDTDAVRTFSEIAARRGIPAITESPSNDALVVLGDADLDDAVEAAVRGRFASAGQSRRSPRRWIVSSALLERFERAAIDRMNRLVVGAPRDARTDLGPLADEATARRARERVEAGLDAGATRRAVVPVENAGDAWFGPVLLGDVEPGAPPFDDLVAGPVGALIAARDDEHAIALADATPHPFGLSVFTRRPDHGEALARSTRADRIAVNALLTTDPRLLLGAAELRRLTRRRSVEIG